MTIAVLIYLLHKPFIELLPNLTMLKARDFELHFEKGLARAEEEISELPPPSTIDVPPGQPEVLPEPNRTRFEQSPEGAVLTSWRKVEQKLEEYAAALGLTVFSGPTIGIIRQLAVVAAVPRSIISAAEELRKLRNLAVHGAQGAISDDQATRYVDAANDLMGQLQQLIAERHKTK